MENEKITMALWLMRNKSSSRGMKQRPLRPSQMYITYIPHAAVQLLWVVLDIGRNNCCFGWIGFFFFSFFSPAFYEESTLAFDMSSEARTGTWPCRARSRPASLGGCGKVSGWLWDGSQFHKIHRIFHKWMNTISFQFPHYANMQNIKSRPI